MIPDPDPFDYLIEKFSPALAGLHHLHPIGRQYRNHYPGETGPGSQIKPDLVGSGRRCIAQQLRAIDKMTGPQLVGTRLGNQILVLHFLAQQGAGRWDIILIDCPPSLGLLTLNAMVAVESLLVPLQCEFFALEGLSQLLQTVERIRARFNRQLSVMGVVLTMYDRRNKLTEQVSDDVRACLGDVVFETVIPRNVRLSEAPSHGLPALIYDYRCSGSVAYIDLARELIGRLPDRKVAA